MNHAQMLAWSQQVTPELTPAESQFARAVSNAETNYSRGWVGLARKLGVEDPERFADVHNFGAITAPASATDDTSFFMRDRRWRRYATPELGWKDAVRTILKPNVRREVNAGRGAGAVAAMGKNGYFIEPGIPRQRQVDQYRRLIENSYLHMVAGTGEPSLLRFERTSGISDFLTVAGYVGGVVGAIWLFSGGAEKHD